MVDPSPPVADPRELTLFAAVVVGVDAPGLRQPFTYRVPDSLRPLLAVGTCVVVPFGYQEAIGFVLALSERAPDHLEAETIKDVAGLVTGEGAHLPDAVLKTAQWMSRNYLTDLALCVRTVVPDAQTAHIHRRYRLAPDWAECWQDRLAEIRTATHRDVVRVLGERPERAGTEAQIADALNGAKLTSPLSLLRQRGVLIDEWRVDPPKIGAKQVKAIRLLPNWDEAESIAATWEVALAGATDRERKSLEGRVRLLRTLIESGGGPIPTAELLARTDATAVHLKKLEAGNLVETETITLRRKPFKLAGGAAVPPMPTGEQTAAVEAVKQRLDGREANVVLLYGVTGSGKTEVYLRSIAETRRRKKTALVLVPEIALTAQVMDTFRARIGDRVAVLHSGLSAGERRDEWQRIGRGEADVVVGARSAIFAPLEKVGLIVVDEEHEASYKQDAAPRYHARDVAIARARATGATVLLGSATPAMESFYRAEAGEWGFLPLRERALSRPLPSVQIIDLREGYKKGDPPGIFAPPLMEAITDRLAKREQTILFLNRRGYAQFLLCRDCGYTTRCPHCDVSLTFHSRARRLMCHHCGFEKGAPSVCPVCTGDRIRPFGLGTERIETEVRALFPDARVLRMDRDTTQRKDAHLSMLKTFRNGDADILIGTQMVAKGLDFAGVTLVGVISADTALNMPDFRASERAFQLLTQVSGRAGRGRKPGHVIVQTFNPEHESVAAAAEHDYETFYRQEIGNRRELGYPPFTRLANIIAQDEDGRRAEAALRSLAGFLGGGSRLLEGPKVGGDDDLQVLGPAPCPLSRLQERYRWHLLLKAGDIDTLRSRIRAGLAQLTASERSLLHIDIDPMSLL
ncbi:MAG: primosomal protein N' [Capsulimonadales bacterium]|nr:primosomal protein N' [Capsulimonadales bacterium]